MKKEKRRLALKCTLLVVIQAGVNLCYLWWKFGMPFRYSTCPFPISLPYSTRMLVDDAIFLLLGSTFCIAGFALLSLVKRETLGAVLGMTVFLAIQYRAILGDHFGLDDGFNVVLYPSLVAILGSGYAIGRWWKKRGILGALLAVVFFVTIFYVYDIFVD
ncbi:MAG: hypothetical protein JSV08_05780 [Acidobacteriota bacterium]|nr:MAG: hypothetical protein JSV08_05780 [Acidobacteriota bacterium]